MKKSYMSRKHILSEIKAEFIQCSNLESLSKQFFVNNKMTEKSKNGIIVHLRYELSIDAYVLESIFTIK